MKWFWTMLAQRKARKKTEACHHQWEVLEIYRKSDFEPVMLECFIPGEAPIFIQEAKLYGKFRCAHCNTVDVTKSIVERRQA